MSDSTTLPVQQPALAAENQLSQLEQIDNLLSGKTPDRPEKAPATGEPGGDPKPLELDGDTPEGDPETEQPEGEQDKGGIDYAQEVPLNNGEKMSVGALKDFYQGYAQKELAMIERENKVMAQYGELQELGQYMQLPPEQLQRIQAQQQDYLREQHGLMLTAIPDWQDKAVFERDRGRIFDLGKEYGVDLGRVTDHRVVKMLNDFSRLRASIREAKANVKPVRSKEPVPPARPPAGKGTELQARIDTAKRTGNVADQLNAVDLLLRG